MSLPYVIGILLSAGVALFARKTGLDRDRAFYPTVMIVIALYYVLFAAMSGEVRTVLMESAVMTVFVASAVAGFRSSQWIVVAALAGHGIFDGLHGHVVENSGVPVWWPPFCLAYDVSAAAGLAWLLRRGGDAGETVREAGSAPPLRPFAAPLPDRHASGVSTSIG
jgi:hypothetical protein